MSSRTIAYATSLALMLPVVMTACGDDPDPIRLRMVDTADFVSDVADWSTTIEWTECDEAADCGTFEVPFDYGDPSLGTFTLPLHRHRAADPDRRIGVLLVNPGGPGGSGTWHGSHATWWASPDIVRRFDVIGWDPRGVGASVPAVDCAQADDGPYVDHSPDDMTEFDRLVESTTAFAAFCAGRSGDILPHVGTLNAAADIDVLRRALGEETISFIGFSYGTRLGSTWISLFPDTVRAAVLDGSIDPVLGYVGTLVARAAGFESALTAVLDSCDWLGCDFSEPGEEPADALDRLAASIDATPLDNGRDLPPTTGNTLFTATMRSLYDSESWTPLVDALNAVADGDGVPLLLLAEPMYGLEDVDVIRDSGAMTAINCADRDVDLDPSDVAGLIPRLQTVAPRIGLSWVDDLLECTEWPAVPQPAVRIKADTAVRTVVVGTSGDAATPLPGSVSMTRELGDARLIVADRNRHTAYGRVKCVTDAVDEYLLTLVDGPDVLEC